MAEDKPITVAICVPSGDMLHANFAMSLAGMLRSTPMEIKLIYAIGNSSIVAVARNLCVDTALKHGAEYILFLDSDMTFPGDTLMRLLCRFVGVNKLPDVGIVGATYPRRSPPHEAMVVPLPDTGAATSGMTEVQIIPTGCMMIDVKVFERLKKPYFRFGCDELNEKIIGEDVLFCNQVRDLGLKVYLDTELSFDLGHMTVQKLMLQPMERPNAQRAA